MAEESDLEKTEAASPRRLEKAREEGQIARSRELGTFMMLAAGVAAIWAGGGTIYQGLSGVLRNGLAFDQRVVADPGVMVEQAVNGFGHALMAVSYTHLDVYKRQACRCGWARKPSSCR